MKIGYLMNSYPMTSTTFIRSEIEALESMDIEVKRYAVRRWDQALVDSLDIAESSRTKYLLGGNPGKLFFAMIVEIFTNLTGVVRAIGPWTTQIRRSDGNLVKHMAYLLEAILLRRLTKCDGVAHLHVHFSTNSAAVAMLTRLLGGPTYSFTAHGPDEFSDRASGTLYLKIQHAEFIVAISDFCRVQLVYFSDIGFWEKIHIVRCGIRLEDFVADSTDEGENQTLICIGRLCVQKGQLLLPEVAACLRKEFPDLRIVLIGDGPIRKRLEKLIKQHNVGDLIELKGWRPNVEVRRALQKSRALLLPSFAEGLPIVIMEALALGRPVISTYIAGIPELVDPACGWIVPSGSQSALASAIRAAMTTERGKLRELGLEGRRRVEQRHDVKTSARQLRALFAAVPQVARPR